VCICGLYVLQGDQKVSVHLTNNPHTTDDLKMAITEYIRSVDRAIPNMVFENTVQRANKCLENGGGHFEHTCNVLCCNRQMHRDFLINLYVRICVCVCMCVCVRPLYIGRSDACIDLFLASLRIVFRRLNSPDLQLNIQSVPRSKHSPSRL